MFPSKRVPTQSFVSIVTFKFIVCLALEANYKQDCSYQGKAPIVPTAF